MLENITRRMIGDDAFTVIESIMVLSEKQDYIELEKVVANISNQEMEVISGIFLFYPC